MFLLLCPEARAPAAARALAAARASFALLMVAATFAVMLLLTGGGMLLGFSRCDLIFCSALALPVEASGSEGNLFLPTLLVLGEREPGILEGRAALLLLPGISCPGAEGSPGVATKACVHACRESCTACCCRGWCMHELQMRVHMHGAKGWCGNKPMNRCAGEQEVFAQHAALDGACTDHSSVPTCVVPRLELCQMLQATALAALGALSLPYLSR